MHTRDNSRWTAEAILLWLFACGLIAVWFAAVRQSYALSTQDFRCFYAAGQMLLHERSLLYNLPAQFRTQQAFSGRNFLLPFYHVAYEALLYVPFTAFSYKTAYIVYAGWNTILLWLCYLVSPVGNSIFANTRRPALFFLSFPLLLCVFVGENAILVLLVVCLATNAMLKNQDRRAGLLLGLVTLKLAVIVPLAFLLTIRRGRKFLVGFVIGSGCVLTASLWISGLEGMRQWLRLLRGATLVSGQTVQDQHQLGVWLHAMPNLTGLLYLLGSSHLPAHTAFAFNTLLTIILLGSAAYIQRRSRSNAVALSAAFVFTLLVTPHLFIYDLSLLVIPLLLLKHRLLKLAAAVWFLLPPVLYAYAFLTWMSPAVVIDLLLLGVCLAEFRRETRDCASAFTVAAKMA